MFQQAESQVCLSSLLNQAFEALVWERGQVGMKIPAFLKRDDVSAWLLLSGDWALTVWAHVAPADLVAATCPKTESFFKETEVLNL